MKASNSVEAAKKQLTNNENPAEPADQNGHKKMETTKLINEVQEIINSKLSYVEKVMQIKKVKTNNRPGAKEAENMIREFLRKYREYKPLQRSDFFKNNYTKIYEKREFRAWSYRFRRFHTRSNVPVSRYLREHEVRDSNVFDSSKYNELSTQLRSVLRNFAIELKKQEAETAEKQQKVNKFCAETGLGISFFGKSPVSMQEFQRSQFQNYCKIRDYYFSAHEDIETDWNYYSKAWHRAHGPKKTVNERFVKIYKDGKTKYITVDRWAGNWFFGVLVKFFDLKPVKVSKNLRAIQINPYYDIQKIEEDLYEVRFLDEFQAYCAIKGDITYHANTIDEARRGLIDKIRKAEEKQKIEAGQLFSAEYLHEKHGFCYPAMREFANLAGLDINETYSLLQLRNAVVVVKRIDRSFIAKYIREFRTINVL